MQKIPDHAQNNALRLGLTKYLDNRSLELLRLAKVGIIGLGGLGSNAAMFLARSGIEQFILIDYDCVDRSNLNRQHYWPCHLGLAKVEAMAKLLLELNPYIQLEKLQIKITAENVENILTKADFWLEAVDQARDKQLLVNVALAKGYRMASASGIAGYGLASLQRRYLHGCAFVGDFESDANDLPVLAPRVTEAAALLADSILAFVLNHSYDR